MRDDDGVIQLWTVSPNGGEPTQVTRTWYDMESAFTWSPDGTHIACVTGGAVGAIEVATGRVTRHISRWPADSVPRAEACVFSPDGRRVAYVRPVPTSGTMYNQVFVCDVPD
jgi:Tol biopolymer transport system component